MRALLALLAFTLSACATAPATAPATFANPVLDEDFPDPAVIRAPDGYYYAYATQTEREGKWVNLQVARSLDLVAWEHLGDALPVKPAWAGKTQDFWAPHVARDGGNYLLYYSAKPDEALTDDKKGLCLAVATAERPQGPFTDMGRPLLCGASFVNIDPMAYDDPATGKRLLYWGSGFESIKVRELAADRMSFAPGSETVDLVPADPQVEYRKLVEGAWVIRRDGFYYLFFSGDNCCGAEAKYAVMVARSRSAAGPFEIKPGAILERRDTWHAPGHNGLIEDGKGEVWMLYHAVDTRRPRAKPADAINTRRIMLIDRVVWRDGWPLVEGPTSAAQPRPLPPRGARR